EMNRVLKPGGMAVCLETSQPTMFGYRQAYYFYFQFLMPLFGKVFAKSYNEYSWLQESAKDFPGMKELADMFRDAGFEKVTFKPYVGGAAAMHMGFKKN
ncbi:class I SAM-dependent methyltransferase, partial [Bacillus sp. SG-1]|uniref:class I SAM-dependent methyltransferase n=1 Tax=Bacillus sp. SG-1 TaxID=161544 RepID=UPI00015450BC